MVDPKPLVNYWRGLDSITLISSLIVKVLSFYALVLSKVSGD